VRTCTLLSSYAPWYRHFEANRTHPAGLPWRDTYRLSAAEAGLAGRSIQQFQLGEWARGRGLRRRAAACAELAGDPWFLPALDLFIAEEQGHSRMLGVFLDIQRIPRLERDWADQAFRRLRKLAGLELCVMTLVTAEALAIPFYRALREATASPLLRSICGRILCDEAAHLGYQALTLGLIRRPLGARARAIRAAFHSLLFHGATLLLWWQHASVFRAAGWDFGRFWSDCRLGFNHLQEHVRKVAARATAAEDLRLD
jgi:hypothetical protein